MIRSTSRDGLPTMNNLGVGVDLQQRYHRVVVVAAAVTSDTVVRD